MSDESVRMKYEAVIRKLHDYCDRGGDPNGYADADFYDMHSEEVTPVILAIKESLDLYRSQNSKGNKWDIELETLFKELDGLKTEVEMNSFIGNLHDLLFSGK